MGRRIALVLAVALALAGCGPAAAPGSFISVSGDVTAVDADGHPIDLADGARLQDGEVLTVADGDAVAEIAWLDGSITRLAGGTSFEVGGTDADGSALRGTLLAGTAWNRVAAAPSEGFAFGTPSASVSATDAVFVVACGDAGCEVSALSGSILAGPTHLDGPASATLGRAGFAASAPLPWDAALGDTFAKDNASLDADAGFGNAAILYAGSDPALAGIQGTLSGTGTFQQIDCSGAGPDCASINQDSVGDTIDVDFVFDIDCSAGIPCFGTAVIPVQTVGEAASHDEAVPVAFDGTTYTWSQASGPDPICTYDDGTTEGESLNTLTWSLTPTEAKVVDGEYVVTAATGTGRFDLAITSAPAPASDCVGLANEWTIVESYSLTRDIPADAVVEDQAPVRAAVATERPSASRLATGSADAPSVLRALPTFWDAPIAAVQLAAAAAVTIVLVLLLTFPTALLDSAVEAAPERWTRLSARLRRRRVPPERPSDAATSDRVGSRPWWAAASGVVAAGVLSAFVDPQLGLNPGSVRVAATIVLAFFIDVVLGWSVAAWLAHRIAPKATVSFHFRPWTLAIVVAAVVLTRIVGFEPGVIFGLVAGIGIGAAISTSQRAKVTLAQSGYAIGLGVAAWVLYSLASRGLGATPGLAGELLIETLAAVTTAGIAATPIALLPFRGLTGRDAFEWKRRAWAISYAAGLACFFFILMPMPTSWSAVGLPLETWIALYVAYVVVAIAAWLAVARPWRKRPAGD